MALNYESHNHKQKKLLVILSTFASDLIWFLKLKSIENTIFMAYFIQIIMYYYH